MATGHAEPAAGDGRRRHRVRAAHAAAGAATKFEVGSISRLNAAEAELSLSTQQAARTQLVQASAPKPATRWQSCSISRRKRPVSELSTLPEGRLPPSGPDLPAEILANRRTCRPPSCACANRLRTSTVVRTSFYPTLTLTGSPLHLQRQPGQSPAEPDRNRGRDLAAGLSCSGSNRQADGPGSPRRNTRKRRSASAQRLYTALAEVENALSARTQLQAEEQTLRTAVEQARLADSIARARFEAGASDVQLWLDASSACARSSARRFTTA